VLEKLAQAHIPAPRIITSDNQAMRVDMTFLRGPLLRDALDSETPAKQRVMCRKVGALVARMHAQGIMHADLTTSNIIMVDTKADRKTPNLQPHLIDFGLSFFSQKIEDMAVDLHLLRQALEAGHHDSWKRCFAAVLDGYQGEKTGQVKARLAVVERRGRYKGHV